MFNTLQLLVSNTTIYVMGKALRKLLFTSIYKLVPSLPAYVFPVAYVVALPPPDHPIGGNQDFISRASALNPTTQQPYAGTVPRDTSAPSVAHDFRLSRDIFQGVPRSVASIVHPPSSELGPIPVRRPTPPCLPALPTSSTISSSGLHHARKEHPTSYHRSTRVGHYSREHDAPMLIVKRRLTPQILAQTYSPLLAIAAEVVYQPSPSADIPVGWHVLDRYEQDGLKAVLYLVTQDATNLVILGIRGTQPVRNWAHNITEVSARSTTTGQGLTTTAMATLGCSPLLAFMQNHLRTKTSIAHLLHWMNAKVNNGDLPEHDECLITGHSLGGFLASHLALELGIHGIGFSAPALGLYENKYQMYHKTEKLIVKREVQGLTYLDFRIEEDLVPHSVPTSHLSTLLHGDQFPVSYPLLARDMPIASPRALAAHSMERMRIIIHRNYKGVKI